MLNLIEMYRDQEQERVMQEFAARLSHVMWPFKPGDIYLSMIPAIPNDILVIEVGHLPKFKYPIVDYFGKERKRIVEAFAQHFAEIYVEPDDHIQLGLE